MEQMSEKAGYQGNRCAADKRRIKRRIEQRIRRVLYQICMGVLEQRCRIPEGKKSKIHINDKKGEVHIYKYEKEKRSRNQRDNVKRSRRAEKVLCREAEKHNSRRSYEQICRGEELGGEEKGGAV